MVPGLGDKYQKGVRYVAGGMGRGGARHKGVFSTPKPKRWIHEDAANLDTAVISKALLKFEELDEAVIGVDEVEAEAEAMVTGTGPEEYSKFVTGHGMNVVGMLLPGNRGPCKTGGSAIPGHNYVRPTQKGNQKWECFYCKLEFAQSQTVTKHMKTTCRSVPSDWICEELKGKIRQEEERKAAKDAEEKIKEDKRALAAAKKAEAAVKTKQKRNFSERDDSVGGKEQEAKSLKASTASPLGNRNIPDTSSVKMEPLPTSISDFETIF